MSRWVKQQKSGLIVPRPVYDRDTERLLARMTTQPDATRKGHIDTLIKALKSAGIMSQASIMYVIAAHDVQAARLNWCGRDDYNLVQTGTVTFTTDRGLAGNGTDGYHSTGFTAPSSPYQDSHFMGVWSRTNHALNQNDFGNTRYRINSRNSTNLVTQSASATADTVTIADSLGFTCISRGASGSYSRYRNGASLGDATQASTGGSSNALLIGARGQATPDLFSTREISFAIFGFSPLSSAQQTSLYNAVAAYMTAVGA